MSFLHRWALDRAERAEYTTIAMIGAQNRLAIDALIEELASIRRHGLLLGEAAVRAGQHRL